MYKQSVFMYIQSVFIRSCKRNVTEVNYMTSCVADSLSRVPIMAEEQPGVCGYKCEFKVTVPDELNCKKCTLVARKLVITSCCGESFCQTCIADTSQLCPVCGEDSFSTFQQVKNQKKIFALSVYCGMKERGCVWSGTLDQLDTHLDPHLDNCQYVDTKCPLNCLQTVPKNKVDQHVAQECTKRPHVCQHCGFKATYEEVVDTHLPECKYVALQCPNMCGVSCEREVMEDHMKICRLEEVECEFSSVGCDGRFIREDQDEHARQNSQKHLTLTASLAVETKEQLQQKLQEQDKKHKEEEEKLKKKVEKQENKLSQQERKLEEQMSEIKKLKSELQKLNAKYTEHNRIVSASFNVELLNRRFEMRYYSNERAKDEVNDWKSPAMYTHANGYKFCIGVDANGYSKGRGKSVNVDIFSMPGEFDDQLQWPARARFTIELVNQKRGKNAACTSEEFSLHREPRITHIGLFDRIRVGFINKAFIRHSDLPNYISGDTLYFFLSRVEML